MEDHELKAVCRLRVLPLVNQVVTGYSTLRNHNSVFRLTLITTEWTLQHVVKRLHTPIRVLDVLACQLLDLVGVASDFSQSDSEDQDIPQNPPSLHRPLTQQLCLSLESALVLAHAILDFYLPDGSKSQPPPEPRSLLPKRGTNIFQETQHFSETLKKRIQLHVAQAFEEFVRECDHQADNVIAWMEEVLNSLCHQLVLLLHSLQSASLYLYDGLLDCRDRPPPQWFSDRGAFLLGLGLRFSLESGFHLGQCALDCLVPAYNRDKIWAALAYSCSLYSRILLVRSEDQAVEILRAHTRHKISNMELRVISCLRAIVHAPLVHSLLSRSRRRKLLCWLILLLPPSPAAWQ